MALIIAFVGGVLSLNYMLKNFEGFDRLTIGQWAAFPLAGTLDADLYTKARHAKQTTLSLGEAEGLRFQIWKDNKGKALNSRCQYILKGQIPTAQFFTIYPVDLSLRPIKSDVQDGGLPFELHSQNIIRNPDNSFSIMISPTPYAGNWLASNKQEEFGLVLNLYNTPIATSTALQILSMPILLRANQKESHCD